VRELLTIVEAVVRHPQIRATWPNETAALDHAKISMYDVTGRLVESAKNSASAPWNLGNMDKDEDNKSLLLQAATGTLRTGTECVRLVRLCAVNRGHPLESFKFEVSTESDFPRADDIPATSKRNCETNIGSSTLLRPPGVGQRGDHTLSSLDRKVTSLSSLQQKYVENRLNNDDEQPPGSVTVKEQEEAMAGSPDNEDVTLQPAIQLVSLISVSFLSRIRVLGIT
jgi:hypothetical protein